MNDISVNSNALRETAGAPRHRGRFVARVLNVLASVKFAVGLVIVIAVACVIGTLLPQGAEAAAFIANSPKRGAARVLEILGPLGFTNLFQSWWFIALLCVLAASVATCSTRRFATVRRAQGGVRLRALGSMLTHISILLILAGAVVRGVWGEVGFIELREGETRAEFHTGRGPSALPFALRLARFDVETYSAPKDAAADRDPAQHLVVQWPARALSARVPINIGATHSLTPAGERPTLDNTFFVKILRYLPDVAIDGDKIVTRSDTPKSPALLVEVRGPNYANHRWVFAHFPDLVVHSSGPEHAPAPSPLRFALHREAPVTRAPAGPVKSFKSTVEVVNGGATVPATVEVNRPLKVHGYTLYQSGYNPRDLAWTSLEVRRDPGVPLVYAGFILITAGLFTVFYLNPWLEARKARA